MDKNFKPHHGRISLASPIGRGVINAIKCADNGMLVVDGKTQPCTIGLYCVEVLLKEKLNGYATVVEEKYLLVGKTESGEIINNSECRKILELPVKDFTEDECKAPAWLKGTGTRKHELDGLVPKDEILQTCIKNATPAIAEEIERLRHIMARQKAKSEYVPDDIKMKINSLNKESENTSDRIKQTKIKRQISLLNKELRIGHEELHRKRTLLDEELKQKIEELTFGQNWTVRVTRQFLLRVTTE